MNQTLREILERYTKAYDEREAGILAFLDDEGELEEGRAREEYDEHCRGAWNDSHGDLGSLLSELTALVGLNYRPGDRVLVLAGAETANGGEVYFEGEVEATVLVAADEDGDVKVKADYGPSQYVAPRYLKRLDA